jgi:hypothetical protein
MLRFMIGSYNVNQTYEHEIFLEYKKYRMVCCTKLEVSKVAMAEMEGGKGEVIIAVIKNLPCDQAKITINREEMKKVPEEAI